MRKVLKSVKKWQEVAKIDENGLKVVKVETEYVSVNGRQIM